MLRGIVGVVVGAIVWWVGFFFGLAQLLMYSWPAYATMAREFMATGVSHFTTSMYVSNAVMWVLAEVAAGWIAVVIARRRGAGWALAALLMAFLCFMHLYREWDRFPGWYNLAVALPSGAAVLLGGRLAGRFVRRRGGATGAADTGGDAGATAAPRA